MRVYWLDAHPTAWVVQMPDGHYLQVTLASLKNGAPIVEPFAGDTSRLIEVSAMVRQMVIRLFQTSMVPL